MYRMKMHSYATNETTCVTQTQKTMKLKIRTWRMATLYQTNIKSRLKGLTWKEMYTEKVYFKKKKVTRYCVPIRNKLNTPVRLSINARSQSSYDYEPSVAKTLKVKDTLNKLSVFWDKIRALQQLDCRNGVNRARNLKVLHTKFVLQRKCNHNCKIEKCKARLVVCGNEKSENHSKCFSLVVDYTLIKVLLCLAVQKKYKMKHFDNHNVLPNSRLECLVYVELPRHISSS